jgi:hypothetical protein
MTGMHHYAQLLLVELKAHELSAQATFKLHSSQSPPPEQVRLLA